MDQLSIGIRISRSIKALSILIFVVLFTTGCSTLSINKDLLDTKNYKQTQSYQDSEKEFKEFAAEEFSNSSNETLSDSDGMIFLFLFLFLFLLIPFRNNNNKSTCGLVEIMALIVIFNSF